MINNSSRLHLGIVPINRREGDPEVRTAVCCPDSCADGFIENSMSQPMVSRF